MHFATSAMSTPCTPAGQPAGGSSRYVHYQRCACVKASMYLYCTPHLRVHFAARLRFPARALRLARLAARQNKHCASRHTARIAPRAAPERLSSGCLYLWPSRSRAFRCPAARARAVLAYAYQLVSALLPHHLVDTATFELCSSIFCINTAREAVRGPAFRHPRFVYAGRYTIRWAVLRQVLPFCSLAVYVHPCRCTFHGSRAG